MKSNIVIFWILAAYFFIVGVVYMSWNLALHNRLEWAGTLALIGCASLGAFIAFYLGLVKNNQGGVLTEDLEDSDIDDGDPQIGEFSPWSWWPVTLAFAIGLATIGMSIGFQFWMAFLAIPFIAVSIVGWVYEYYRGNFAR